MFVIKFTFYDQHRYVTSMYDFVNSIDQALKFKDKKDAIYILKTLIWFSEEAEKATSCAIEKI